MSQGDTLPDRNSIDTAEEVMSFICPDVSLRRVVLKCLLDSTTFAGDIAPGAWAVTLFKTGFRLNVGRVEALTCDHLGWPFPTSKQEPVSIRILTQGVLPNQIINDVPFAEVTPTNYVDIPSPQHAVKLEINNSDLLSVWFEELKSFHQRYIAFALKSPAGKTRKGTSFKRTHSPGLIDYAKLLCAGSPVEKAGIKEKPEIAEYFEGRPFTVQTTRYERDSKARQACLTHHGYACAACGFHFESVYGTIAANYIQVHHLNPVSSLDTGSFVNPITDMQPLCANCHAVAHFRNPPYTVEEIKNFIKSTSHE